MTAPISRERLAQVNGKRLQFLDLAMSFQKEHDLNSLEMIATLQEAQNAFIGVLQAASTGRYDPDCPPPPSSPPVS